MDLLESGVNRVQLVILANRALKDMLGPLVVSDSLELMDLQDHKVLQGLRYLGDVDLVFRECIHVKS